MSLSRRPLTSSDADADLFVDRDDEIRRIERSIELRANVLVVGPPGSGKTSLLRRLQGRSREAGDEWVYVDCSPWQELEHTLAAIAARLGRDLRNRPRVVDPADWELEQSMIAVATPRIVTELDVGQALRGKGRRKPPRIILIDGLAPELAFDLFGRFRDTLWQHEHRWVVTAEEAYRGDFLRPPADVFFETVVDLAEFEPPTVKEMLWARLGGALGSDDSEKLTWIADALGGGDQPARYPGSVVAIAREILTSSLTIEQVVELRRDVEARAEELGETAAAVFRTLRELGAVHAGDERLLRSVNLSRGRVVQLLKELEGAGLVEARRQGRKVMYGVVAS